MKRSTAGRTLYYYGKTVMKHWPFFLMGILASFGYAYCLQAPNGQPFPATIVKKTEDTFTFDANHEMAGKELNFDIELVEVEE